MVNDLLSPFKKVTKSESVWSTIILLVVIAVVWSTSTSNYIPTPLEIIGAFPRLMENDILGNFGSSLWFCFSSMFYSIIISLILCYLSVLPLFRSLCGFIRKFRFLPSAGLSFLFMKLTGNMEQMMSWMMIWGITTWLCNSMIGIALSITDEDVMYTKSLRLSRWSSMKELLIFGKASDLYQSVIENFALAWMLLASVENLVKASGGIGVVLSESNKYYRFDEVYLIQILILVTGIAIDGVGRFTKGLLFPYTSLKN